MSSKLIIHGLHYKLIVLRSVGLRSENSTLSLLRSLQMRIKVADKFALPRRYRYVKCKGSWYLKRRRHGNVALWGGHEGMRKSAHGRMKSLASITVAEPGGARGARPHSPCFQTKLRPEGPKYFFLRLVLPPFLSVWMTAQPPTSLSEDPPLRYWCLFLKSTVFRWESFCCHRRATVESIWTKLPSKTEVSIEGEKRLFFVKWFKC